MGWFHRLKQGFISLWPFSGLYNQCNLDKFQRRTLNAFVLGPFFANAAGSITNGPALTGFLQKLNVNDFTYGLMSSLPLVSTVFYMMGSWLLERTGQRKKLYISSVIVSRSVWLVIALIPWIIPMQALQLRIWSFIILNTSSAMLSQLGSCTSWTWQSEAVPVSIQGRFLAIRGSMINIVIMLVSLLISIMLDAMHNTMLAYSIAFGIGAVIGISDALCFIQAREKPMEPMTTAYLKSVREALKNRSFTKMMAYWTIYFFTLCLGNSFYGRYALGTLGMSITLLTLFGQVLAGLAASMALPVWGRLLDKHGRHWVIPRSLYITMAFTLLWILAKPGQPWWAGIYFIGFAMSHCGLDITQQQAVMGTVPDTNRSIYIALMGAVNGLFGIFPGVFMAGVVLSWMGDFVLKIGTVHMDRYQILFIGATVLRLGLMMALLPMISRHKGNKETVLNA